MKKLFALLAMSMLLLASCSDSDDKKSDKFVSPETKSALAERFPNAKQVGWEVKGQYLVAEFMNSGKEVEAWFDNAGAWFMTETDMIFSELPGAVQSAFRGTEYADWKVDDVDKIERANAETLYKVEVEKKNQPDVDLYFSEDGILVNKVIDSKDKNHENLIPQNLPANVKTYLDGNFKPSYRIIDVDMEIKPQGKFLEVEIIHDGIKKDVYFKDSDAWSATKWELRRATDLPQAVLAAINSSIYSTWSFDDIDYLITPDGVFYLIEFEKNNQPDTTVRFCEDGQIVQ